ncbi:putative ribonuclease H-like domain-containing protein [Tanacetum coccineum]
MLVQVYVDDIIFRSTKKSLCTEFEKMMHKKFHMSSMGELTFFLGLQVKQKKDGIFISQDKYVTEILKKSGFTNVKTASTPMKTQTLLLKDEDSEEVDVHLYRLMIGSLMYLTSLRPDIIFAVCACVRYQVNPKILHLHAVKRIFRYLKGQPKLGLWYPKDSPFNLVAYSNSDYAGASLDRKSTTGDLGWNCYSQQFILIDLWLILDLLKRLAVFSGRVTPLFPTMVVQDQEEMGEDEVVNEEMYDSLVRAATTASGLEAEQDSGNIDKTQSKATPNESSSPGTSQVVVPGAKKPWGTQLLRLGLRMYLNFPMIHCSQENIKTAQDQEITSLKLRVKKLENKGGSRTHKLKRLNKGRNIDEIDKYAEITLVDETQGRYGDDIMFDVSDLAGEEVFVIEQGVPDSKKGDATQVSTVATTVSTAKLKSAKPTTTTSTRPRAKGLVIYEQEQASTPTVSSQQPSHAKIKDKEKAKANIALKETWDDIHAKIEADQEKKKTHFVAKREEEKRNKPPIRAQQRSIMCTYLKNMEGWQPKDLKSKSFANIQELFDKAMKRVNTFVDYRTELIKGSSKKAKAEIAQESSSKRAGDELEKESVKKQKVDEDKETAELQSLMQVIPDEEEVAIDAVPLDTKPLTIVDWKFHKEGKNNYYQIIRADESSKMYKVFSQMLKSFDM